MWSFLIALRNAVIVALLAWLGLEAGPDAGGHEAGAEQVRSIVHALK